MTETQRTRDELTDVELDLVEQLEEDRGEEFVEENWGMILAQLHVHV